MAIEQEFQELVNNLKKTNGDFAAAFVFIFKLLEKCSSVSEDEKAKLRNAGEHMWKVTAPRDPPGCEDPPSISGLLS